MAAHPVSGLVNVPVLLNCCFGARYFVPALVCSPSNRIMYEHYFLDASAAQDTGEPGNDWNHTRNRNGPNAGPGSVMALNGNGRLGSGNIAAIDMQNAGKIKFDPPKVPVIFVLGGPGSGKVTHCDTFMQERRGVTHINMMDLLQQYAMGSGTFLFLLSTNSIH